MHAASIIRQLREASRPEFGADLQAFAAHCRMAPDLLAYCQKVLEVATPYMGEQQWMTYAPASVGGTANLGWTWASKPEAAWEPDRQTLPHALSYAKTPEQKDAIAQKSASTVASMLAWQEELEQKLVAIPAPALVQNIQCSSSQGDPSVEIWFSSDIFDDWWEEGSAGYDT